MGTEPQCKHGIPHNPKICALAEVKALIFAQEDPYYNQIWDHKQ
jgi:hypothetical protein